MRRGTKTLLLIIILLCWNSALAACSDSRVSSQANVHVTAVSTRSATPIPTPTPVAHEFNRNSSHVTIPASLRGSIFFHGNTALHELALTFDDGPSPLYTPQILAILQHYHVNATFFCVGQLVQANPALVREVHNAGQLIANHTWDHANLATFTPATIRGELRSTTAVIAQTLRETPLPIFRPPYGAINGVVRFVAAQMGLLPVMWNVDTNDWRLPGSQRIINTALIGADNGAIILMHDGGGNRAQTVLALPTIITVLRARGFKFVTIEQLLMDAVAPYH